MRLLTIAMVLLLPTPCAAQWSSDLPGVPRASIVRLGSAQGRFELDASRLRAQGPAGDSTTFQGRLGAGWSWRVASAFEFGFDVTLAEAQRSSVPTDAATDPRDNGSSFTTTGGYGLRFGLKFRPVSYVDPDGNGMAVAVGIGYQPKLDPLIRYQSRGDSSFSGGILGGDQRDVGHVHAAKLFMAAFSYRSPRLTGDVAFVAESVDEGEGDGSLLRVYSGLSPRAGIRYRVGHGLGLGVSFWGKGAPPWRDRLVAGISDGYGDDQVGLMISLGATPEKSTDFMISSPAGSFGRSVTIYIVAR